MMMYFGIVISFRILKRILEDETNLVSQDEPSLIGDLDFPLLGSNIGVHKMQLLQGFVVAKYLLLVRFKLCVFGSGLRGILWRWGIFLTPTP